MPLAIKSFCPDKVTDNKPMGYASEAYCQSLSEFGTPLRLPHSQGNLLARRIPSSGLCDLRGSYPLFSCDQWENLEIDLQQLTGFVSLVLVSDPFCADPDRWKTSFPDLFVLYKQHFVTDLAEPLFAKLPANHLRNAQKALKNVQVELCHDPLEVLDDWVDLYENLIGRHGITGLARFSRNSFKTQFETPGFYLFRATAAGQNVGMLIWLVDGQVGYYHLAAYSDLGYELKASFALFFHSIQFFSTQLRFLCLGAGAGVQGAQDDGLTRFKRGWSTETRPVYLCGRIFNHVAYEKLAIATGTFGSNDYFPLYRKYTDA